MISLENGVPGTQDHQMASIELVPPTQDLQLAIEELRKKCLFYRPRSSGHVSLAKAGRTLLALKIDSVEKATELGIRFNTQVYSKGKMSLEDFIIQALEAAQLEKESGSVPMPMA